VKVCKQSSCSAAATYDGDFARVLPETAAEVISHLVVVLQLSQYTAVFLQGQCGQGSNYMKMFAFTFKISVSVTEKSLRTWPAAEGDFCLRWFILGFASLVA